jgi:iron complex outermembrane receptor protein
MSDSKPKEDGNGNKVLVWRQDMLGAYYDRAYEAQVIGSIMPKFEGSWSNDFEFKNFTLNLMFDARFGGDIASYSNKYGTAYGWMETSLQYRDEEHGGITWTSQFPESQGITFHDGVIPDGVFADGTVVNTPTGSQVDVGGMSYQEAYDNGYVEPTHASFWTTYTNGWSTGTVNDNWFSEIKYVAFRNVSLGYRFGKDIAKKIKAQSIYLGFNARNLGYVYNSLPNNLNPEGFRGTTSSSGYMERSFTPYTTTYTFTLSFDF